MYIVILGFFCFFVFFFPFKAPGLRLSPRFGLLFVWHPEVYTVIMVIMVIIRL